MRKRVRAVSRKAVFKVFIARHLPHLNHASSIVSCCSSDRLTGKAGFPGKVRRTADPSASLGMTKERVGCPWGVPPFLCHPEEPTCLRQVKSEMDAEN
jgi:hypothetical protein